MARKRKGRPINGVLLVDKPQGMSSNHVVQHVKRLYQAAKAGHTGALDPLATGLLPVCLGEATKFSQFLLEADKSYFVTAKLGERTDTSDADGEIVEVKNVDVTENQIRQAIKSFLGPIKQIPSMFSALKHNGKPLYSYARQGITIEREARDITIYSIDWCGLEGTELSLQVSCSKGTYIRSLVDDLGQMLGCGAHVKVLRRTGIAHYDGQCMHSFEDLETQVQDNAESTLRNLDSLLLPMDSAILHIPTLHFSPDETEFFQHGGFIAPNAELMNEAIQEGQLYRVYELGTERFIGLGIVNSQVLIQPKRLVVYSES